MRKHHPFVVVALVVLSCLVLANCASPDEWVGVAPGENAVQCIRASYDGYFTDSTIGTTRLELPANLNLGTLPPELVRAIADLAERMGCAGPAQ